ncbi:UvrD-helicase domain-containing protein [Fusobacterium sp. MFO224]|uniref:UvrD-helicase domain-containing protein n=1 Tax=Fusobacterium sp. MFO224 TaxID=3378070 RepID=UPI00385411DA
MKFFIRDKFFKNISNDKKEIVEKKLYYFYKEVENNKENIKEISNGFWIKKIKGFENRFEFRINNGDRVFFSLERRGTEEERITFILYSNHDRGILKNNRANIENINIFNINKKEIEDEKITEEDELEIRKDYNDIISYEFKNDDFFKRTRDKRYYYLNDEQYRTLTKGSPLFVAGSAGSGKSTITLRKVLNLEAYQNGYGIRKVGYFTRNLLLKDEIQLKYNIFRNMDDISIVEFYSLNDYYRKVLNIDRRKIINFQKFKEFLKFSFPNIERLKLELLNIYFEVVGVVEGLMNLGKMDNWDRDIETSYLSLEDYLKLSKNYSVLDENQKKEIYKICKKYNEWKKENGYYDSNDLSLMCIKKNEKFDFLVVDEIQDFTEVEIFLLFSLVKNKNNMLVAGDIHQMVAFNAFSFERIRNLYYSKNIRVSESLLSKNYRNSKKIVNLANTLTDIRKEYIGTKGLEDYKENFVIEEGTVNISSVDFEILKKMNRSNAAILVSDSQDKDMLVEKGLHRIFTIEEIKGLEYEDIICFNVISKNLWAWEKIFSKKVKLDQRYRKYFNLFYVGITRAIKNLVIMEEEISDNPLLLKLKEVFSLEKDDSDVVKEIIGKKAESTKEEWLEEGKKLYKLEKIKEAEEAFINAGDPTWILRREIEEDILNEDYEVALKKIQKYNLSDKIVKYKKMIIDDIFKRGKDIKCLKYMFDILKIEYRYQELKTNISKKLFKSNYLIKEVNEMIPYFSKKRENILLGDIYFYKKEYKNSLKFYEKSGNKNKISEMRIRILEEKFKNIENRDYKVSVVKSLIGNKEINYFDRSKLTPLFKALDYEDIDIVHMMIFLGGDVGKKVKAKYTLLTYIAFKNYNNSVELISYFLKKGLNINERDNNLENMLFHSVRNKNKKLTNFLFENKIEINGQNILKENLLFQCVRTGDLFNFKRLLNLRIDTSIKNYLDLTVYEFIEKDVLVGKLRARKLKLMKKIYNRILLENKTSCQK